ncbi:MAG: hypothetical protein IJU76_14160 [Desulfovibrionaceae bacterium]|nr:hypothetical protein [Desulfovibrionaceae bacterium]
MSDAIVKKTSLPAGLKQEIRSATSFQQILSIFKRLFPKEMSPDYKDNDGNALDTATVGGSKEASGSARFFMRNPTARRYKERNHVYEYQVTGQNETVNLGGYHVEMTDEIGNKLVFKRDHGWVNINQFKKELRRFADYPDLVQIEKYAFESIAEAKSAAMDYEKNRGYVEDVSNDPSVGAQNTSGSVDISRVSKGWAEGDVKRYDTYFIRKQEIVDILEPQGWTYVHGRPSENDLFLRKEWTNGIGIHRIATITGYRQSRFTLNLDGEEIHARVAQEGIEAKNIVDSFLRQLENALKFDNVASGLNAQGFNFSSAEIKRAIEVAEQSWRTPYISAEELLAQWRQEGLSYPGEDAVVPASLVPEKHKVEQPEGATLEEIYKLNLGVKDRFLDAVRSAAEKSNGTLSARPGIGVKGRERALEKTMYENDGNFSALIDVVGASIIYRGGKAAIKAAVPSVIATLQSQGWKLEKVKDRYFVPAGGGYKDVLMNFSHETVDEDGQKKHVVVELQLLTDAMNQMKNHGPGHALYEATRTIQPLVEDKKTRFGRGERRRVRDILAKLEMISEKLYAAADAETSPNASGIGITELSNMIETIRKPLSGGTSLTSSMLMVLDKAEEALASILKMYPSAVSTYGTSLYSRNRRTTNDDGLSSSGNENSVGNETTVPSGSVNGIRGNDIGQTPGVENSGENTSSTTNIDIDQNGSGVKQDLPYVVTLNDILAGKYDYDIVLAEKRMNEAHEQAEKDGRAEEMNGKFNQVGDHIIELAKQWLRRME